MFDVIKSHHDSDRQEVCPKCGDFAVRDFCPQRIHLMNTSVKDSVFNPGLGCVIKNDKHLKEICKIKNVEPIGNEKPEKIHAYYDKKRAEKIEQSYAKADRGWVGSDGDG